MKALFYHDLHKNNAYECVKQAAELLSSCGVEIMFDISAVKAFAMLEKAVFGSYDELLENADVVIAAGGDGTMLRCAKSLGNSKAVMLGINTGRLGFLASLEQNELHLLKNLANGEYSVNEHMMLDVKLCARNGLQKYSDSVLNEVVVSRASSHMCDFGIWVDDTLVSQTRADGVMLSTPTGSTAYALSAGGPLIEPYLECIEFIPICSHSLFSRPMLLSPHRCIKILPDYSRYDKIEISCDGKKPIPLMHNDFVTVCMSDKKIRFAEIKGDSFFDSINKKLIKPLKDDDR